MPPVEFSFSRVKKVLFVCRDSSACTWANRFRKSLLVEYGIESEISLMGGSSLGFEDFDLVITLGGDGTVLCGLKGRLPVLAFNQGTVGFLAEHNIADWSEITHYLKNTNFSIEPRSSIVVDGQLAINDLVIQRRPEEPMLELEVSINGETIGPIRADGLVVATPTGSTGYSLACGGPVVHPTSDSWIISPMCSRAPGSRAIVIPPGDISIVSIRNPSGYSIDGTHFEPADRWELSLGPGISLIKTPWTSSYMRSLEDKMGWSL